MNHFIGFVKEQAYRSKKNTQSFIIISIAPERQLWRQSPYNIYLLFLQTK